MLLVKKYNFLSFVLSQKKAKKNTRNNLSVISLSYVKIFNKIFKIMKLMFKS